MRPLQRTLAGAVLAMAALLSLAVCGPVNAQQASGLHGSFCSVLTADQIAAVLSLDLAPIFGEPTSCTWDDSASGGSAFLSAYAYPGTLADARSYLEGTETTVAGYPALLGDDGSLYVERDGTLLTLALYLTEESTPQEVQAALLRLAEVAVARLGDISLPIDEPEPSLVGDDELAALFPTEVAGQAMSVQTMSSADILAGADDEEAQAALEALSAALSGVGKTLADVSVGLAYWNTGTDFGGLTAVRVKGADVSLVADEVLTLLLAETMEDPRLAPAQLGGREVIRVTDGPDRPDAEHGYAYAGGEVLWIMQGAEEALVEILGKLP